MSFAGPFIGMQSTPRGLPSRTSFEEGDGTVGENFETTLHHTMGKSSVDRIKVCVRMRPQVQNEKESGASDLEVAWKWSDQHIVQDKFLTAAQAHAAAAAASSKDGRDR